MCLLCAIIIFFYFLLQPNSQLLTFMSAMSGLMEAGDYNRIKPCFFPGCNFTADSSTSLNYHLRKHFGEGAGKLYKCSQCPYKTALRDYLTFHAKNAHAVEKPFKCPLCPYRSAIKGNVKIHVNGVHATEKPFKCTQCPYRSARKHNLALHMTCRHPESAVAQLNQSWLLTSTPL